jgi:hypothetical protein
LNTNTQGREGEKEREWATHERFGRWKKQPPDNKAKVNLDHMTSRTGFGEMVDTSSSYL